MLYHSMAALQSQICPKLIPRSFPFPSSVTLNAYLHHRSYLIARLLPSPTSHCNCPWFQMCPFPFVARMMEPFLYSAALEVLVESNSVAERVGVVPGSNATIIRKILFLLIKLSYRWQWHERFLNFWCFHSLNLMSHIATAQLLFKHQLARFVKLYHWLMFSDEIWLVACRWSHGMPSSHLFQSLSHFCAKLQLSNCIRPGAVSADVKTSLLYASVDVRSFVELRFWLEPFLRTLHIIQPVGVIIIFPFQGFTMIVWWSSVIISCMLLRLRRRLALVLT